MPLWEAAVPATPCSSTVAKRSARWRRSRSCDDDDDNDGSGENDFVGSGIRILFF
jgi:hypothetical protein